MIHRVRSVLAHCTSIASVRSGRSFAVLAGVAIASVFSTFLTDPARATILHAGADFAAADPIITFETGSTGLPSVAGVGFPDNFNGNTGFGGDATFQTDLFGSQLYGNLVSSKYSDLAITFATPVAAVGAYAGKQHGFTGVAPASLEVRVLDAANNVLESTTLTLNPTPGGRPASFVGFSEPGGISRVEWLGNNGGFFGVDNVVYGAVAPEPSCLAATIGFACCTLLVARRRERNAVSHSNA
jgi:hypothetical protein